MLGEMVAIVLLLVVLAVFGLLAWRFTLQLIGLDPQEVAMWRARVRERRTAEPGPDAGDALTPAPPATSPSGMAERIDRVLAVVDGNAGNGKAP